MSEREDSALIASKTILEDWLRSLKAEYRVLKPDSYFVDSFTFDGVRHRFSIVLMESGVVMLFEATSLSREPLRSDVGIALHMINDHLPFGGFELAVEGRSVMYKISTFSESEIVGRKLLTRCLVVAMATIKRYGETLKKISTGDLEPSAIGFVGS